MDSEDPTEVRMVSLYHIDDTMVACSSAHTVKLEAHLDKPFRASLITELPHNSGRTFVRDWEKGLC